MKAVHWLLVAALSVIGVGGKPLNCTSKTLSFPLLRQHAPIVATALEPAPGPTGSIRVPIPIDNYTGPILYGVESLIYTVEVAVGLQRFNLTLDTNAQASVLFEKGYVPPNSSCRFDTYGNPTGEDGDAPRNFFDRELSETFHDSGNHFSGWGLYRYPYVSRLCGVPVGGAASFQGIWATDMYFLAHSDSNTSALDSFVVPEVPFVLANQTNFMINQKWPSDGVFPLGIENHQALSRILSGVGGKHEVTLWLDGEPTNHEWPAPGGEITLGGKDTRNCDDQWTTLPDVNAAHWGVSLHSVQVGDNFTAVFNREDNYDARISLATPFLEVPRSHARLILHEFAGFMTHGEGPLNLDPINCSQIDSMPAIAISIGSGFESISYTVPAKEFVVRQPHPTCLSHDPEACKFVPPLCGLLIVEKLPQGRGVLLPGSQQATPDPDDVWVIGSQFLPKRCVHLDYASGDLSFADPLKRD